MVKLNPKNKLTKLMEKILEKSKNKTRVLVLSTQSSVTKLLIEVLHFHEKEFDFYLENGDFSNSNNDFVIFETSDADKATLFEPNIALVTTEIAGEKIIPVLEKMTAGGVLVYHSGISEIVDQSLNFFRKLEFTDTKFQQSDNTYTLQTNIGAIPISSVDATLIQNIDGIKLLAQQFGVMEEEFYEPVMSFE